jgi:predicted metal-dependent peptidase
MSEAMRSWLRQFVGEGPFLTKYRYYAAVLARMDPVEDPAVEVMAVSARGGHFYLHVNVDFFIGNLQYLKGVLLHEVHHVVLGHLSDPKFRGAAHPDLMELAMEISANEFVREPLPGSPPRWKNYQAFGIQEGQSTLERYELLVQARQRGLGVGCEGCVDAHLPGGVGGVYPDGEGLDPGAYVRVRRLVREAVAEADRQARAQGQAASGGRLAGREPGRLLEELERVEEAPRRFMDWRAALQMFVALMRAPVHTYARPNRRFPDKVGVVPGRVYYPRQVKPPKLLVALDTSGSMSAEELDEIARHLGPLSDLVDMTVVECDVVIHRVYAFEGVLREVAGRGGTDLRPVFAAEFLAKHRPDGVIYFTDGEGPYPEEDPGVKTLWVLTKPWEFGCAWGEKAHLGRG